MTTLKTGSVLTSGTAPTDTAPALTITFGPVHPNAQVAWQVTDFQNAPIAAVGDIANGGCIIQAAAGTLLGSAIQVILGDNFNNPQGMWFPDGVTNQGLVKWAGSGHPVRAVTDMVTNGTTTITSATANFTTADVGAPVVGTDLPALTFVGPYIASVTNSTTAVLSQAATGSHSGGSLTISKIGGNARVGDRYTQRDGTAGSYEWRCTVAGTFGTWAAVL